MAPLSLFLGHLRRKTHDRLYSDSDFLLEVENYTKLARPRKRERALQKVPEKGILMSFD